MAQQVTFADIARKYSVSHPRVTLAKLILAVAEEKGVRLPFFSQSDDSYSRSDLERDPIPELSIERLTATVNLLGYPDIETFAHERHFSYKIFPLDMITRIKEGHARTKPDVVPNQPLVFTMPEVHPLADIRQKKALAQQQSDIPTGMQEVTARILEVAKKKQITIPTDDAAIETYYTGMPVEMLQAMADGTRKRIPNETQWNTTVRLIGFDSIEQFCQEEFQRGFREMVSGKSKSAAK